MAGGRNLFLKAAKKKKITVDKTGKRFYIERMERFPQNLNRKSAKGRSGDMSMEKLKEYYYELYGNSENTDYFYGQLLEIMEKAGKNRSRALKKQDEQGNTWYLSEKMAGIMLYLDKFSGNLKGFEEKLDYLSDLGITYVHFMPLLKPREGQNDGGYAVQDYLKVNPSLGTMEELERAAAKLKKRGIRTCIDFVLNHTAKEHEWAVRSRKNEPGYENMYYMFESPEIPQEYEKTLTEIFPSVAPKNFTYYEDIQKYVMTRFYEFQWDLNYKNPNVFNKIAEVLLTLANKGIDIFRLDAIPYMWKELGTSCMNLPQVHKLLKMYEMIAEQVCPSVIFLGEAIVEPKEIIKYFGTEREKECHVMYNASFMVLLWNSLASRDVRLMEKSLSVDYGTPQDGVWINYARCHDDIGWGFENQIIEELGLDPEAHKQFMIQFMEGKFPGSFARGELYEFNPQTLDARNSGTMASLCGLEEALLEKDWYKKELSVKRILLLNSMIISYCGIPLLYSGDELGLLNWKEYKEDPSIAHDSRWLHRPPMDWELAKDRHDLGTVSGILFTRIKEMLEIRKKHSVFSSKIKAIPVDTGNKAVFGFHKEDKMLVLANFSEREQKVEANRVNWFGLPGEVRDLIQGKTVRMQGEIVLGPYEYLWLV